MAVCSSQINTLFLSVIIGFFLIPLSSAAALSFNFNSFSGNDANISYERAYAENNTIMLTKAQADICRATYAESLHLWDKASRNLTDFSTHFSFVIDSEERAAYGDGIAFFLAPVGSKIPNDASKGGGLGLTSDTQQLNSTDHPFVAVEFDIYFNNSWDPKSEHVGIDINSMQSVSNVSWWSNTSIMEGKENEAWISYRSSSKNLSIIFTGFRSNTTFNQSLYHIVDLRDYLPEWVTFGFSAATGNRSAIQTIRSWDFSSSLETNENIKPPTSESKSGQNRVGLLVGLVVGGSVLAGGMGLALYALWRKRKREKDDDDHIFDKYMAEELESGPGPKLFKYNQLARATNNFAQQHKLGEGGFGAVYRGFLKELNSDVAVKKVSRGSKQGIKEYASEVKIISQLSHSNLVQLIGCCHEKRELLLVYEFMPNGSLDYHLFRGKSVLPWALRYKIAQDLASAVLYLHEEWEQCVLHRDIKSSNVVLDSNFNAKLGDFGLARLVDHEKGFKTTSLVGTRGYIAPECFATGKGSREADVYSFGVVALEIACGRQPIDLNAQENKIIMVEWVWDLYGMGQLLEAADPKLFADFDQQQMEALMIVGLWCTHPDSNMRPSIREAILVLGFEAPLPTLPLKMPVASY